MEVRGFFLIHRGQAADLKNRGLRLLAHDSDQRLHHSFAARQQVRSAGQADAGDQEQQLIARPQLQVAADELVGGPGEATDSVLDRAKADSNVGAFGSDFSHWSRKSAKSAGNQASSLTIRSSLEKLRRPGADLQCERFRGRLPRQSNFEVCATL